MDRKATSKQTPPLPVVLEVGQSNGFQVMGQVYADLSFKLRERQTGSGGGTSAPAFPSPDLLPLGFSVCNEGHFPPPLGWGCKAVAP